MRYPINPENRTKQLLKDGVIPFGIFMSSASPRLVEFCALGGADFIVFDTEHHPFSLESMEDLIRACETSGVTPMVRLNDHNPKVIGRYLDMGCQGIIAPGVDTADEAAAIVRAARYWPAGDRGLDLPRGAGYGRGMSLTEYASLANEQILVSVMIEHAAALDELDEIISTPGLDIIDIGPTDLSASMGHGGDTSPPEVVDAVNLIIASTLAHTKVLSDSFSDPRLIRQLVESGRRMLCSSISSIVIDSVNILSTSVQDVQHDRLGRPPGAA